MPESKTSIIDADTPERSQLASCSCDTDSMNPSHPSLSALLVKTQNSRNDAYNRVEESQRKIAKAMRTILECVGEDITRQGMIKTPDRYAKAMMEFTAGYRVDLRELVNGAIFAENHHGMVIVKDIEVKSLCEHHLVPFIGRMHIGYIPQGRILGLSKFARIVEVYARRLQVQERLTEQVAQAIDELLMPSGVAVTMESSHLCMIMRGVEQTQSRTITSCMLGTMESDAQARSEFLTFIKQ